MTRSATKNILSILALSCSSLLYLNLPTLQLHPLPVDSICGRLPLPHEEPTPPCPPSTGRPALLLVESGTQFGRTGNKLIEFMHALQYGKEHGVIVGAMLDSWVVQVITQFWIPLPPSQWFDGDFMSWELRFWKERFERSFCFKIIMTREELDGYNVTMMDARDLFFSGHVDDSGEYMKYQMRNIRTLFRYYNRGIGVDSTHRPVKDLCSVVNGMLGHDRQHAIYSVIHSRSLEGKPGIHLLSTIAKRSGCDPLAALHMEPGYIKAILGPMGMLNHPILFLTDGQNPHIFEALSADAEIGPKIRSIPPEWSWIGGDVAAGVLADVFIGNPASTFSGFIAKSRLALGRNHTYLFRVERGGEWVDSCEDWRIFDRGIMGRMA